MYRDLVVSDVLVIGVVRFEICREIIGGRNETRFNCYS